MDNQTQKKHSITNIGGMCFLDVSEQEAKELYCKVMMDKTYSFKGLDHCMNLLRHRIESSKKISYQRIEFDGVFECYQLFQRNDYDAKFNQVTQGG